MSVAGQYTARAARRVDNLRELYIYLTWTQLTGTCCESDTMIK